jgi:hypothetical protein
LNFTLNIYKYWIFKNLKTGLWEPVLKTGAINFYENW